MSPTTFFSKIFKRKQEDRPVAPAPKLAHEPAFDLEPESPQRAFGQALARHLQQPLPDALQKSHVLGAGWRGKAMDSADISSGYTSITATSGAPPLPGVMGWYASSAFIGWSMCAIISQRWLVDKCCSMPGRDAVRNGWELAFDDGDEVPPEVLARIKKLDTKYKVVENLQQMSKMNRVFGIRLCNFEFDGVDDNFYSKPYNIDGVTEGSLRGIAQTDPQWAAPQLVGRNTRDPGSIGFYEPDFWRIGGVDVHASHLVILRGPEVPDLLKPTYFYGGIPLTQRIYDRVYGAERLADEALLLSLTKRSLIIKTEVAQVAQNQGQFTSAMKMSQLLRDNYAIRVVDKEDEVQQLDTTLADLDAVIMTQYQLVAAVAEIPATKLLGTSPKGFGASGDYEIASYHQMLESLQTCELTPFLLRYYEILFKSDIPELAGRNFSIVWNPLNSKTDKEMAEINNLKADTATKLFAAGAISADDERNRLIRDKDSGYTAMEYDIDDDSVDM
jgi:phage-related protein (TIGR01555 family)